MSGGSGDEAFIIQQQRQEALEQQLTPSAPDVRLSANLALCPCD